jgi:uncharacterized protein (TIGR03437 family)
VVSYISQTQVNVQAPSGVAPGESVLIAATAPSGSTSTTAAIQAVAPGLFSSDGKYAVAQHGDYFTGRAVRPLPWVDSGTPRRNYLAV